MASSPMESPKSFYVENGYLEATRVYLVVLKDHSINDKYFTVLFDPFENNGSQDFGVVLNNGTINYYCSGRMTYSNGTLTVSNGRVANSNQSTANWGLSIKRIRCIA